MYFCLGGNRDFSEEAWTINEKSMKIQAESNSGGGRESRFLHENNGYIKANSIIGDVKDKKVVIFDDMFSSCKTVKEAVDAVEAAGGSVYAVCATHGLFVGDAEIYVQELLNKGIKVVVTDSVKPYRLEQDTAKQITVIPTAPIIAEAVRRIHNEESVSGLIA